MKRSRNVKIALVAGLAMSGCGRAYDPCAPQTFNQDACYDAISHNGYYYGGRWFPHTYSGGYSAYYNSYYSYVRGGGSVSNVSPSDWARPANATGDPSSTSGSATGDSSVSRGVFGSSAHGSGSGAGE